MRRLAASGRTYLALPIPLEPTIAEIVMGIRRVIEDAQPEAVADIYYSGMILTGGGSMLKGLKDRLQTELKLRATMPENPITRSTWASASLEQTRASECSGMAHCRASSAEPGSNGTPAAPMIG